MGISDRIDQLHIDPHLVVRLLHTAFENVHHPKLLRDFAQIRRHSFEPLGRRPRDHLQVGDLRESGEYFILHTFREKRISFFFAQIIEWQYRDRFCRQLGASRTGIIPGRVTADKE